MALCLHHPPTTGDHVVSTVTPPAPQPRSKTKQPKTSRGPWEALVELRTVTLPASNMSYFLEAQGHGALASSPGTTAGRRARGGEHTWRGASGRVFWSHHGQGTGVAYPTPPLTFFLPPLHWFMALTCFQGNF